MNCEPNETYVNRLPPGAAFELTLTRTTGIHGMVVQHLAGSTLVDCGGSRKEHWQHEAPVVPHPEVRDVEQWLNLNGGNEMSEKKEKKARAPKAAKEPKKLLIIRYEPTAKDGSNLLAKENTSQAAAMYRALVAAKEPLTIAECYAACKGKMESVAAWERLGKNQNSTLFALRKAGLVKKSEKREEVAASAAA